jgi:hypothetical protein
VIDKCGAIAPIGGSLSRIAVFIVNSPKRMTAMVAKATSVATLLVIAHDAVTAIHAREGRVSSWIDGAALPAKTAVRV